MIVQFSLSNACLFNVNLLTDSIDPAGADLEATRKGLELVQTLCAVEL